MTSNPLLADWDTPFGVPPFGAIETSHYLPAFRAAMAEERAQVDAITACQEVPDFSNTIEQLERCGQRLIRISRVFFGLNSSNSNDEIRDLARQIAPELAAHRDDISLDATLFARVDEVFQQAERLSLNPEQRRLLDETYKSFVRAGANLETSAQGRLRAINSEIALLSQTFAQNLLADTNSFEVHVIRGVDLGNLPGSLVAAAASEARRRGHEDGWSFTLAQPSIEPFLQYSPNRELRQRIFEAYARRGDNADEHDNNATLTRLAALRCERAGLLGYSSHAHYVLSDAMAETPERVYELLDKMWPSALRMAKAERDALQAMMHDDGLDDTLRGWDWRYYAEKVRQARFALDEDELRPYFEFTAVRNGAFLIARKLFGLEVRELEGIPVRHPEQQAFEVLEANGTHVGLIYMDFFARESKKPGAWMNALRSQSKLDGDVAPIITNEFNFPPPTEDSPSLLSFRDAETVFHEFGHALHGLLSSVTYGSLSGTNVPRDFVEFPSQVLENWLSEPEVLRLYARHFETGEVIPDALIAKLKASAKFNQGFATVEYMAACYLDLAWHTLTAAPDLPPATFEAREMARIGLIDEILPRYRSTYFSHIFAGGYASGYYGYLWSEVLDADGFEAFRETSLFDPTTASKYRHLLSQGGARPGMDLYQEFRGRAPVIEPLLERRGLA